MNPLFWRQGNRDRVSLFSTESFSYNNISRKKLRKTNRWGNETGESGMDKKVTKSETMKHVIKLRWIWKVSLNHNMKQVNRRNLLFTKLELMNHWYESGESERVGFKRRKVIIYIYINFRSSIKNLSRFYSYKKNEKIQIYFIFSSKIKKVNA